MRPYLKFSSECFFLGRESVSAHRPNMVAAARRRKRALAMAARPERKRQPKFQAGGDAAEARSDSAATAARPRTCKLAGGNAR